MKRGDSGLSLMVAVNKPVGMSSHDVVNQCRCIFGERRVGHTGTLDPLATGVLPLCIGPATRLDRYMTAHDKHYRTTIALGVETSTDDALGEPLAWGEITDDLLYGAFAKAYIAGLVGKRLQTPPRYSAIKNNGKKAYELARVGKEVELKPRSIQVYQAALINRYVFNNQVHWVVDFSVSKGTYIRALARDIGRELGCYAHVAALERRQAGKISIEECVSLESLNVRRESAAIDPVHVLGFRFLYADNDSKAIMSGAKINSTKQRIYEFNSFLEDPLRCACTGKLIESSKPLMDSERVSIIVENRLKGIYRFESNSGYLVPDCVFATGVSRG